MKYERLHLEDVSKTICGVLALDRVNLDVYRGEMHMVLGECGAGKSTLARLITAKTRPDAGRIYYNGNICDIISSWQAVKMGIRSIGLEDALIGDLSIKDNILLGKESTKAGFLVRERELDSHLKEVFQRFGLRIDVRALADSLRFAQKRLIEMVKLWYARCELIVLDDVGLERFSGEEIEAFRRVACAIKADGGSILLFSRDVYGIAPAADRFSYLKDGRIEYKSHTALEGWSASESWGESRREHSPAIHEAPCQATLCLHEVSSRMLGKLSLEIRMGEVVGISGEDEEELLELARVLSGWARATGDVKIGAKVVRLRVPQDAVRAGIVTLFGMESADNLISDMGLEDLATLPMLSKVSKCNFVNRAAQAIAAEKCLRAAGINWKPANALRRDEIIRLLLARCEWMNAKVIVCHEITNDMSYAQKLAIHGMIREIATRGYAFVILSTQREELSSLCDRVLILKNDIIRKENDFAAKM